MLITVFRSRLKPGLTEEYNTAVQRMSELAETMPGYISHKTFFAQDGASAAPSSNSSTRTGFGPGAPTPNTLPPKRMRG
jgi:hypothetical protein